MPIFAALFGAFSTAFGLLIAKVVAVKVAARAMGVAAFVLLSLALVATFNTAISPLVGALFSTQYGQFLGLLFPPIAGTVTATLMSFWLVVMAYRLQTRAIALTANV